MKRTVLLLSFLISYFSFLIFPVAAQDVTIPFDISQKGKRFSPTWGIDQAWISEQNARKAINHMGKENIGIGRACFRTTKPLINDSVLATAEINRMRERNKWLTLVSDTLPVVLTVDQEAGSDEYYVANKSCNVGHWAANINSHVHWMQENSRHPVVGVSIFNEPDYWSVEEGASTAKQTQIAKLLREEYPRMNDVVLTGGNTLNDDKALEWYTPSKAYLEWGNTHQLAGSFNNFAKFYQQVAADGKVGYADEMHNVGEAMVALEYGATIGIWWGFDSRARGEFCDISRHGERIAYGEQRPKWTAASVWHHDDGRVKAFIGSSERQAATTTYQFISLDRDVYFDGQGPLRNFTIEIPGGTGYQTGQTNAERVIDITFGEDVAPSAITEGVYKLVNKATGNVAAVSGDNIVMQKFTNNKAQQWNVSLSDTRIGGDYSFYDFTAVSNPRTRMNLRDFSCLDNANIMAYSQNTTPTSNEQWYLQYAGNGYYYIRNRESALYMASASSSSNSGINVVQRTLQTDEGTRDRLLWRLLPKDVTYETEAPAKPTGLIAELLPTSVKLMWQQSEEADLDGYLVLRYEESQGWNTIARHVWPPYVDNTALPGHNYQYKVKAIDLAQNISEPSIAIDASISGWKDLVAHYTFDGNLLDQSENQRHATAGTELNFDDDRQAGSHSLNFNKDQYLQLPANIVQGDQFTVSFWLKPMSSKAGQRIFDFGYDNSHYIALLSYNTSSRIRLVLKNGDDEQVLDCPDRLSLLKWRYITVAMESSHASIYIDGQLVASNPDMQISASEIPTIVNYIGRSQAGTDPSFTGYLDDLRIYNYALSSDEAAQLYNEASGIDATPSASRSLVEKPSSIHTLDGLRHHQPQQGINIIDGKKVIVK
jgi:hypothetical protein